MPRKPKRGCAYPGCPRLTEGQYCKDSLYGKPSDGSPVRHYSRKKPYNKKRLKQTVFKFAYGCDKEAV